MHKKTDYHDNIVWNFFGRNSILEIDPGNKLFLLKLTFFSIFEWSWHNLNQFWTVRSASFSLKSNHF